MSQPKDPLALVVTDLSYSVAGRTILTDVSLSVSSGASLAVLGRSGSGKTTLLSVILGLIRPTCGSVVVQGRALSGASRRAVRQARRDLVGMVFQNGELLPELTPLENVMLARLLGGGGASEAKDRAESLLESFGVPPSGLRTATLSSGERQRVALARALVNRPALLLADEPTGALDTATRDVVAQFLFDVPRSQRCAAVVVTHDQSVAARADSCVELVDGVLHHRVAATRGVAVP